ncbi:hypothetical protein AB0424_01765 [Streptomyces sp. NPDC051180]|uniref:hypothetical protein n=1 Tax=Streptomyces sp. NPDC051180 TaxID=3155797 RepID=UPI0034501D86
MARTAHHIPRSRRPLPDDRLRGDPWCSLLVRDLRYSAASAAEAARNRSRPQPQSVRRAVDLHSWPRFRQDRSVARWAAEEERKARQRLRARTRTLTRLVNGVGVAIAHTASSTVDVPPARHRRCALWWA